MARSTFIVLPLLIAYSINLASAVQIKKVQELCPYSPLQASFNQILNNYPLVGLYNDTESAAIVRQIWDETSLEKFQDCAFHVDSNLYFNDAIDPNFLVSFRRGLTMSVRKINFRYDPVTQQCIDYVRFTFPGVRTDKICGTFDGESEIGQQTYINDPNGVIKVHIFVDKSIPLKVAETSVEIELIFTAYEDCSGENLLQCHPSDNGFCISDALKNDGIHNCPPPSNADEPDHPFQVFGEEQQQQQQQQQKHTQRANFDYVPKYNGATPNHAMNSLFYLITLASLMIIPMMC